MWSDILELGELDIVVNENCIEEEKLVTREVFCNEKSVGIDEYYKSSQFGYEIKIILEIKQVDYNGEQYVIYKKKTYEVKRTYKSNSEDIELHCALEEGLICIPK